MSSPKAQLERLPRSIQLVLALGAIALCSGTAMPVVPEGARQSTLNINSIHGGEPEPLPGDTSLPAPCVADRCRIVLDRRFLIEEALPEVKAELTAVLERVKARRPSFSYTIRDADGDTSTANLVLQIHNNGDTQCATHLPPPKCLPSRRDLHIL